LVVPFKGSESLIVQGDRVVLLLSRALSTANDA